MLSQKTVTDSLYVYFVYEYPRLETARACKTDTKLVHKVDRKLVHTMYTSENLKGKFKKPALSLQMLHSGTVFDYHEEDPAHPMTRE